MKQELERQIADRVAEAYGVTVPVVLTRPEEQFGDYATNVALQLAKQVGKPPREIAEGLAGDLRGNPVLTDVSVAGPGFINVRLADGALLASLDMQHQQRLEGKTYLVEYSDPNPFKPLHAGHLYTTLVGDSIARLVEHAGAKTIRLNYGGDVGLHTAKSMWAIVKHLGGEFPEKMQAIPDAERPAWLGARYVEGNNAYEDDPAAKEEIAAYNKKVYDLHAAGDHDSPFAQLYWLGRTWSYEYFAELYRQLEVVPFDRFIPESEVTEQGFVTVQEQLQAGVFSESDNAIVFVGEPYGLHTRVFINSGGLPTYETKEVGLLLTKWNDYHFDGSIVITAHEQKQYMEVVFKAIEQFAPEPIARTQHMTHGMVKLQGGTKMSSRKGNIVTALEILAAARAAGQATGTNPSEETILAAVKYAFAKNRIGGDICYDPQESIALEGNSGPYLQYAHARARSIGRKSQLEPAAPESLDANERSLVRKLAEYTEVVNRATEELAPHHICTYLYELSQAFNRFYEANRVVGDIREANRLWLVLRYADTLQGGLALLGIVVPDSM